MTPSVAIAIITLDRHAQLAKTLDHLRGVDLSSVSEVLIVDQTESLFEIESWSRDFPVPLRLVNQKRKGLSSARNEALRRTDGDIILFIDDDVIPDRELVNEHLRTYVNYTTAIGVAGREIVPPGRRSRFRSWTRRAVITALLPYFRTSRYYRRFLNERGYPVAIVTRTGLFLCDFTQHYPCRVITVRGCNMSFRREALLSIGGFDDAFAGPRRDESDVSLSLLAAMPNGELRFNPLAKLTHLMIPTGGCRSDPNREWYVKLLQSELRFARKHLTHTGYVICSIRLAVIHVMALIRYPSLFKVLLRSGSSR